MEIVAILVKYMQCTCETQCQVLKHHRVCLCGIDLPYFECFCVAQNVPSVKLQRHCKLFFDNNVICDMFMMERSGHLILPKHRSSCYILLLL